MKRLMITVAAIVAMGFASAQGTEIVKVMGRGVGADKTEALKDAYHDAVERAVGLYVNAEQMMKNEELVKDQILTHSNAYIEKYDVVGETVAPTGLVTVKILAEVKSKTLTTKMAEVMPAAMYRIGGDLSAYHAKSTTVEKRNQDGAALLKEFLKDFDPLRSTIDFTLASPKMLVNERESKNRNHVAINYFFQLEINQDRYFNDVVPKLREVLRQVSISNPIVKTIGCVPDKKTNVDRCVDNDIKQASAGPGYNFSHIFFDTGSVGLNLEYDKTLGKNCLYLVVGRNKYNTAYKIEKYELNDSCLKILSDYCCPGYNQTRIYSDAPLFTVSFVDKESEILYCEDVKPWPDKDAFSEMRLNMIAHSYPGRYAIAPWAWATGSGLITFRKYRWFQFQIPKDIMPEIANMKIEMK